MRGLYLLVGPTRTWRWTTDLGNALRWYERVPQATHLIGPSGMIVADRRP